MLFPGFERLRGLGDLPHDRNLERMVEDNPLISERMAHDSDNVRSRLEEAKRGSIEQVRQLQRLQMLRDDKALKDGDWANRLEAIREKMPPNFSREDIAKRIQEVSGWGHYSVVLAVNQKHVYLYTDPIWIACDT